VSVLATSEVLPWWLGLTGLWLLTLSTPSVPEVLAAAVAALPCALVARSARRAMSGSWRPRIGWFRWLTSIPRAAVGDSVRALVTVFRQPDTGRFDDVGLPREPESVHEARLAVAAIVVGCTPGTMVIAAPPGERRLVVHRLLDGGSPVVDQVTR
jgi:multisubunit Na+/H+ antiporter MnhE subunit